MNISISPTAIQSFLSQNISKLRPTTSLIISSAENPNLHNQKQKPLKTDHVLETFHHAISQQCKSVQFYTSMKYNLKTVQYGSNTLTSSFPTNENGSDVMEFIRRTMGVDSSENSIFGVGSGASIDLAKSCYLNNKLKNGDGDESPSSRQQLVLIPSTLGSVLAATSKKSLILDVNEEALMASQTSLQRSDYEDNVHILIDPKSMAFPTWFKRGIQRTSQRHDVATILDASLASLAIAIDAHMSLLDSTTTFDDNEQSFILEQCIKHSISLLQQIISIYNSGDDDTVVITQEMKQNAINAVLGAGQLLAFGDDINETQRRNITLALTSALLPKYFPHGNWMTFTASLLPGIVNCLNELNANDSSVRTISPDLKCSLDWINHEVFHSQRNNNLNNLIPSLSSLADGAPDVNELVSQVDHNGAFLNTIDCDSDLIEKVLFLSLNR